MAPEPTMMPGPDRDTLAKLNEHRADPDGPWATTEWLAAQLNVQPTQMAARLTRLVTLDLVEQAGPFRFTYQITERGQEALA